MSKLKIVVPIKQVPDIENVEFDAEEGRIDRSSADTETNPFDLNALEEAVKLKEEIGAEITTISMGPPQAESALKDSIARGADKAILLADPKFAGADTWATSYALATAIKKIEDYDIIFAGEKTVDGDTGQVGPEIAEILGIPHIAFVSKVRERTEESITVETELWNKTYVKKMKYPGLITVTKNVNEPRIPTLKDKMRAKKAEIEEWTTDTLQKYGDRKHFGYTGSPTAVDKVEIPEEETRKGEIYREEPKEAAKKLVKELEKEEIIQ